MQYINPYVTLLLASFMSKLCLMILITRKALSSYNLEYTVLIFLTKINFKGSRREKKEPIMGLGDAILPY